MFLHMAKPFEALPRPLYLLSIFIISTIFHIVLFGARQHKWAIYPLTLFYAGTGVACLLERVFRQVTGRKVGGIIGRVWTWTVLYLLSQPMVTYEYGMGWMGAIRGPFTEEAQNSMVVWAAYRLGWGPSAEAIKQSQMR
jgi:hypothetical protein